MTGFDDEELSTYLEGIETIAGLTDEDDAPEPPKTPVSRPGDLWVFGKHRLLCGDATNRDDIERLMGSDRADLVFTDPPYNVDYEGYTKDKLTIQGDRMAWEQFNQFLRDSFTSYQAAVKSGASVYVCHASSCQREFQNALEAAGFDVRCRIIWAKNTFAWGFGRYKFQHEPIFYCHLTGQKDSWYGDKSQSTLWQEKKPAANRLHPTMKPIELIERALRNSSKAGDCVLDFFGGSGSTLIACERRDRSARIMELDSRYADVISAGTSGASRKSRQTGSKLMEQASVKSRPAKERVYERLETNIVLSQPSHNRVNAFGGRNVKRLVRGAGCQRGAS